jgi:hypothetical protein
VGELGWFEAREGEDIHSIVVRCGTLPVEYIDPALAAEIVLRPPRIPFIEREHTLA